MTPRLGSCRMAAFDLETSSANPEEARIVEAYLGWVGGGMAPIDHPPILVNPGVELAPDNIEIHGYTNEYLAEHGDPADAGVQTVASLVGDAWREGLALVGHNVVYDLTVLERELARHGLPPLAEWAGGRIGLVVDTRVLSVHVDPWRKRVSEKQGAHTLKTCAQVFGAGWVDEKAHGARYDALISHRVARRMGEIAHLPRESRPRIQSGYGDDRHLFDDLAVDLPALHVAQKRWAAEKAASYQEYLRSPKAKEKQDPEAVICGEWPIQYAPAARQEALTP
ncbi:3'-5' exonuclease [Acrocarpospora macrocephala]|uniref:3'-5' exonuclease n=1 Tax=Acrocarpospora macrocephala TaxID=150177 RepID=A0A5M3WH79_9ACTN|nr:exonuclease domain-containing protein [Acrocarpospora macrocephala]GES07482.1 3'-5' exonuclease [Acrocarpospora macrocephala]